MPKKISPNTTPVIDLDVIDAEILVVGTGMGAGAAGYRLAQAGHKVLFIERGFSQKDLDPNLSGQYTEVFFNNKTANERETLLQKSGRSTYKVNGKTPVLGGGLGGSSAVYGAGLLRFHQSDFQSWPFSYKDLLKYYNICDELFQPKGTQDPLGDERILGAPIEMSNSGKEIFQYLIDQQLHPYRTPIGYKAIKDCQECFGWFCAKDCKQTSGNVFINKAVEEYGSQVKYQTKVESLIMENSRCVGVQCSTPSGQVKIKAQYVFLGAGALITPTILLQSKSEAFPQGIGNKNDLVGRYLMRHLIDFFYVKTPSTDFVGKKLTEISLSDYYLDANDGWGIINIVGGIMSPETVSEVFAEQNVPNFPLLGKLIKPIIKNVFSYLTDNRILVTTIMEDEASFNNRILPDSSIENVSMEYKISQRDKKRLKAFRKELKHKLKGLPTNLLKVAEQNTMISHACGTCRMGNDPNKSVVDANGRIHSTDNVYVVDASIFPTSGAANPSLTIAACGLKIADEFHQGLIK